MKILLHTDSPLLYSGLARCGKEIAKRFYEKTHISSEKQERDYELYYAAWHYLNKRHDLPYFLYPLQKSDQNEHKQFKDILIDCEPDVILSIGDIWNFNSICNVIKEYKERRSDAKWVLWLTIDGEHLHPSWKQILDCADDINVFSNFAKQEVLNFSGIQANVIYPGVDKDIFRPINADIKENTLPFKFSDTFVVIDVNQNTDRKNIPLALEGFRDFAKDKDDVFLLLVTNPDDPYGYDLWDFVKMFDLRKKVAITKEAGPLYGMSDSKLNLIYNLASASINTSIGEGLSLPTLEAMAVGIPVLATDYAAISELLDQGGGIKLKVDGYLYGFNGIKRALVSHKDVTEQLNVLYNDYKSDKLFKIAIADKARVFTDGLTWDKTATALMHRIDYVSQKKKFSFVRESVKIKELNPLLVIPSWDTHCGIAEYTKSLFEALQSKNQPIVIFPSNDCNELLNVVERGNYNLVHLQHEFSFFRDKDVLRKTLIQLNAMKVKTVLTMHTFVPGMMSYNEMLLMHVDNLIVHCDAFKQQLENRIKENNEISPNIKCSIEVIPMGCGKKREFETQRIETTKNNLGIAGRYPIVGSFGFLRDQKGFQDFLLAIKAMQKDYPDILALLLCPKHEFGSSVYDEAFFNFVERRDLSDVAFVVREYMSDEKMLDILQCVDLSVLNYQDSPMGGGISAAVKTLFRTQRPIIVNDSIAFLDLNKEVLKIKSDGPDSLIGPIKKMLNDQLLSNALVMSANEYTENNDWENIAQKHLNLYYK